MNRAEKEQIVKGLSTKFSKAEAVILTEYRGLKVSEITELRKDVRACEGEISVVKNRLARLAVKGTGLKDLEDQLKGPTAIATSVGDPVTLAKALAKHAKALEPFKIKGGFFGGKVITASDVQSLANLPSKEVLYGKMLGTLMAPITNFARVLHALPEKLARALKEIEKSKGGQNG